MIIWTKQLKVSPGCVASALSELKCDYIFKYDLHVAAWMFDIPDNNYVNILLIKHPEFFN